MKQLNAHLLIVSKRRAQLKAALADMVGEAMTYVPLLEDAGARVELINTLRSITDGKIYVEVERARLTKILAGMREAEGRVVEAADILSDVAVETFGSMDKREKADFLLEQVRLTALTKDFVRMGILANKINKKVLDEAGLEVGLVGGVATS